MSVVNASSGISNTIEDNFNVKKPYSGKNLLKAHLAWFFINDSCLKFTHFSLMFYIFQNQVILTDLKHDDEL